MGKNQRKKLTYTRFWLVNHWKIGKINVSDKCVNFRRKSHPFICMLLVIYCILLMSAIVVLRIEFFYCTLTSLCPLSPQAGERQSGVALQKLLNYYGKTKHRCLKRLLTVRH